jgi:hypothetical protein
MPFLSLKITIFSINKFKNLILDSSGKTGASVINRIKHDKDVDNKLQK